MRRSCDPILIPLVTEENPPVSDAVPMGAQTWIDLSGPVCAIGRRSQPTLEEVVWAVSFWHVGQLPHLTRTRCQEMTPRISDHILEATRATRTLAFKSVPCGTMTK